MTSNLVFNLYIRFIVAVGFLLVSSLLYSANKVPDIEALQKEKNALLLEYRAISRGNREKREKLEQLLNKIDVLLEQRQRLDQQLLNDKVTP